MLEIKNLSIQFSSLMGTVKAVRDVGLSLKEGEVLGLAGESGCGKTTAGLSIPRLLPRNATIVAGQIFLMAKTYSPSPKRKWNRSAGVKSRWSFKVQ